MTKRAVVAENWIVGGRVFTNEHDADAYLAEAQAKEYNRSIFDALEFTVSEDHLKLMRRLYFDWWCCETGAPCVDGKRPYGNSDVIFDIADILGVDLVLVDGEYVLPDAERPRLWQRHLEMKNFLQILCRFGEIPHGSYSRPNTWSEWETAP